MQAYNLYAYCSNNPVMNVDPDGNFILSTLIVGAIIGLVARFGATLYADYADDGDVFNGSISAGDYALNSIVGGLTGLAVGAAAPYIGAFLTSSFTFGSTVVAGGTVAVSVSGAQVGILSAILLAEIGMHGKPNTEIKNGGSYGRYDENGNLIFRTDTTGKSHFIKELGRRYLPHTHYFDWNFVEGVWRYIETVLPF